MPSPNLSLWNYAPTGGELEPGASNLQDTSAYLTGTNPASFAGYVMALASPDGGGAGGSLITPPPSEAPAPPGGPFQFLRCMFDSGFWQPWTYGAATPRRYERRKRRSDRAPGVCVEFRKTPR